MSAMKSIGFSVALGLGLLAGCAAPKAQTPLNAPPAGYAPEHPGWADMFGYHNDQGLMADMAIADIHFVPHSSELSGTGEVRLCRYAELLATTGGTIHYDTASMDEDLIKARLKTARDFIAESVPGTKPIDLVVGLPGAPGMTARESIPARDVAQQPEVRQRAYDLQNRIQMNTN